MVEPNVESGFNMIWVYLVILLLGVIACIYIYEKKRTDALKLIAQNLGFSFSEGGRESTWLLHEDFELLSKGRGNRIQNEFWGTNNGNKISIFGCSYMEGSTKHSRTITQTVLSIEGSNLNLPKFELVPENMFHKIGQAFGYQDIDFESSPTFSRKYLLKGNDEIKVRELFTPDVITFFENQYGVCVEAQGDVMIFYRPSFRCRPDKIEEFYQEGQIVLSNFL